MSYVAVKSPVQQAVCFVFFFFLPDLMHYRVVVVSRSHCNHSFPVQICPRPFAASRCSAQLIREAWCWCTSLPCFSVIMISLGSFVTACAFLKGQPHPSRLSLSLRGGNSIWLLSIRAEVLWTEYVCTPASERPPFEVRPKHTVERQCEEPLCSPRSVCRGLGLPGCQLAVTPSLVKFTWNSGSRY